MKRKNIKVNWVQIEPPTKPPGQLSSLECFNLAEKSSELGQMDWADEWLTAAIQAEARERQQGLVAV